MKVIDTGVFGIKVELEGKNGIITSDLKVNESDESDVAYNAAIDGLESLILGHACAGIDITSPAYLEGIESAVDGISNNA